ncbi:hypothetical protein CLOM_g4597 [Closterium sp. NIES-68]|nr:hypothetical protein CLOM_g4597 [Closterium sp. NIES-68]
MAERLAQVEEEIAESLGRAGAAAGGKIAGQVGFKSAAGEQGGQGGGDSGGAAGGAVPAGFTLIEECAIEGMQRREAELLMQVDQHRVMLESKGVEVRKKEAEVRAKAREVTAKEEELKALRAKCQESGGLAAKEQEIKRLTEELLAKSEEIKRLERELSQKEEEARRKAMELIMKSAEARAKDEIIEEKERELQELREQLFSGASPRGGGTSRSMRYGGPSPRRKSDFEGEEGRGEGAFGEEGEEDTVESLREEIARMDGEMEELYQALIEAREEKEATVTELLKQVVTLNDRLAAAKREKDSAVAEAEKQLRDAVADAEERAEKARKEAESLAVVIEQTEGDKVHARASVEKAQEYLRALDIARVEVKRLRLERDLLNDRVNTLEEQARAAVNAGGALGAVAYAQLPAATAGG